MLFEVMQDRSFIEVGHHGHVLNCQTYEGSCSEKIQNMHEAFTNLNILVIFKSTEIMT